MAFRFLRSFVRTYLTMTRRELRGNIILLCILTIQILIVLFTHNRRSDLQDDEPTGDELLSSTPQQSDERSVNLSQIKDLAVSDDESSIKINPVLNSFDPNSIEEQQWIKMGVPVYIAQRIIKYLSKGGKFSEKSDLMKIYGFRSSDYQRLEPYIFIHTSSSPIYKWDKPELNDARPLVELNSATQLELEKLPQIGPKRAQRIIKYRSLLGGFYNLEQLLEVYGMDSTVFLLIKPMIRVDTTTITPIHINPTIRDSLYHPYLKFKIINRLRAYQQSHGPFTDLASVCRAGLLNEDLCTKIAPYLKLD